MPNKLAFAAIASACMMASPVGHAQNGVDPTQRLAMSVFDRLSLACDGHLFALGRANFQQAGFVIEFIGDPKLGFQTSTTTATKAQEFNTGVTATTSVKTNVSAEIYRRIVTTGARETLGVQVGQAVDCCSNGPSPINLDFQIATLKDGSRKIVAWTPSRDGIPYTFGSYLAYVSENAGRLAEIQCADVKDPAVFAAKFALTQNPTPDELRIADRFLKFFLDGYFNNDVSENNFSDSMSYRNNRRDVFARIGVSSSTLSQVYPSTSDTIKALVEHGLTLDDGRTSFFIMLVEAGLGRGTFTGSGEYRAGTWVAESNKLCMTANTFGGKSERCIEFPAGAKLGDSFGVSVVGNQAEKATVRVGQATGPTNSASQAAIAVKPQFERMLRLRLMESAPSRVQLSGEMTVSVCLDDRGRISDAKIVKPNANKDWNANVLRALNMPDSTFSPAKDSRGFNLAVCNPPHTFVLNTN